MGSLKTPGLGITATDGPSTFAAVKAGVATGYAYETGLIGRGLPGWWGLNIPGGSPISARLEFGTDNTGYVFAIAKNAGGTVANLLTVRDDGLVTAAGIIAVVTGVTTGAANGDVIIPNAAAFRAANAGGSSASALMSLDANNVVQLGGPAIVVAVPRLTALAASANYKGVIYADTGTAGQLVFFDGVTGARYKLTGVAF